MEKKSEREMKSGRRGRSRWVNEYVEKELKLMEIRSEYRSKKKLKEKSKPAKRESKSKSKWRRVSENEDKDENEDEDEDEVDRKCDLIERKLREIRMKRYRWEWEKKKDTLSLSSEDDIASPLHEVEMENGLVLRLYPRVKLVYQYIGEDPIPPTSMLSNNYGVLLQSVFLSLQPPTYVDANDVHVHNDYSNPSECAVTVYFRDLEDLQAKLGLPHSPQSVFSNIEATRQILVSNYAHCVRLASGGRTFAYKPVVPQSEYPQQLLSRLQQDYPGLDENPVIVIINLVSDFFAEPGSGTPSEEHLHAFFSKFGPTKYIGGSVVSNDGLFNAFVQYRNHDDFMKALEILCCCSLRKGYSSKFVDYEVDLGPTPLGLLSVVYPDM